MGRRSDEMTFWEHLDELRGVLIRSIIVIAVLMIAAFVFKRFLFDEILLAPKDPDFFTYRMLCKLPCWPMPSTEILGAPRDLARVEA